MWKYEKIKNKYLCIRNDRDDLHPEDETVGACKEYLYLGTKIETGGRTEKEIEEGIIKGKGVIG